jgi:hypothetical protein
VLRRCAGLFAVLAAVACGGPSAPSVPPTPPPPVYPSMVGGWGGTWAQVFQTSNGTGDTTCAAVWIITGQTDGSFNGTAQRTGDGVCPGSWSIRGTVLPDGSVQVSDVGGGGGQSLCAQVAGETNYTGIVSAAGGLTARRAYSLHCVGGQYGGGIDYSVVATYAMNRR